jgi:glycosyltransferase involved in cell wall biosynthesis
VLIAQQSTIPHYRVRFYELLEKLRSHGWTFDVVFDCRETEDPRVYVEKVDGRTFGFPILDARTHIVSLSGRRLIWQGFFLRARHYDLIVTDTHLANLTYPAVWLYRLLGRKIVLWGHPRNMNVERMGCAQRLAQRFKLWMARRADAFLAYTHEARKQLATSGVDERRIFVVNNTIDTVAEREAFEKCRAERDATRDRLGVGGRKVLLFAGRLIADKRIPFLLDAFSRLYDQDPTHHLFVIGGGPDMDLVHKYAEQLGPAAITAFGPVSQRDQVAPIFTASDVFITAGAAGVAPIQAWCYGLPAVLFDLPIHGPEITYATSGNSLMLPHDISATETAVRVRQEWDSLVSPERKPLIYESVQHLTIEEMARRFAEGIEKTIGSG